MNSKKNFIIIFLLVISTISCSKKDKENEQVKYIPVPSESKLPESIQEIKIEQKKENSESKESRFAHVTFKKESEEMLYIPEGEFIMGSPDMDNQYYPKFHGGTKKVFVKAYWIDKFPFPDKKGETPSVFVSFDEAQELCGKQGKRLCTEEEWEKACKGPQNFLYPYGNQYDPTRCHTGQPIHPVGKIAKIGDYPECVSGYGVYEMSGNINELTSSLISKEEVIEHMGKTSYGYVEGYQESTPETGFPILKGGDWGMSHFDVSCVTRHHYHRQPSKLHDDGFRCCKNAEK